MKALAAGMSPTPDERQPILYLRSFGADAATSKATAAKPLLGLYYMFAGPLSVLAFRTEEEQTVSAFRAWGPVVALRRPDESLPELGAVRLAANDGSWRQTVQLLMRRSQLVVIRFGRSEGLIWELKEAVSCVSPEKLLILVPQTRRAYDEFRETAGVHLPRGLPAYRGAMIPPWLGSLRGIVHFDADWTPQFAPLSIPLLRVSITPMEPLAVILRHTLARVIPHEATVH
jgi:hypothetical protein